MKHLLRLAAVAGLAALTGAAAFSAPLLQGQSILVGDTLSINVVEEGPESATPVTLEITEPTYVTIVAATSDETDPIFLVRDNFGRDLITINDNPASEVAANALDAALDNTFLIPGTYTILVGRNTTAGSGNIDFSVFPGDGGVIGGGTVQVIDAAIGANERFEQPVQLEAGQLVSFAAIGLGADFDLRLNLRAPDGSGVARNDDNETFDIFLTDLDPRIFQYRVPESGQYLLSVRGFSADDAGEMKIVVQHHGTLSGDPTTDVITGESENRARNVFHVDLEAGEIIRITARADSSSLDPEIDLLTPDGIFVASNDDHGTEATDLGRFDARIERIVIEETGSYELDVNSVSGRGGFEVTIERSGRFSEGGSTLVEPGTGRVVTPEPTIEPEVTAEPTSNE